MHSSRVESSYRYYRWMSVFFHHQRFFAFYHRREGLFQRYIVYFLCIESNRHRVAEKMKEKMKTVCADHDTCHRIIQSYYSEI